MKKIFLIAALIYFSAIIAQTEKGTFVISGKSGLGFNSTTVKYNYEGQTTNGPKTSSFTISPSVGYFIIDNLELGLELDYSNKKTKSHFDKYYDDYSVMYDAKEIQNIFSIMPNVTYFFSKTKVRPYLNTGIGFANFKLESTSVSSTSDGSAYYYEKNSGNGLTWNAGGGLAYFITKSFSFDLGIDYTKFTYKKDGVKTKSGVLGANIGISLFIK
ncbi:outer membrane protein [Flavobacterium aquicola]|uniref:Outer membrane protein n=1 Tax=Flavobacterium aquicola TaxID=1682742 RepID=A0A3E0EEY3_9FLAO|nr:acyloxyacyl hydrolase [Flavobacterium aquicola]REG96283.1 outer membrane protein [Flavobacterium aquicola]